MMMPAVGDLAFTGQDHPVHVVALGPPFSIHQLTPALVEYLRPDGTIAAVDVCSAGDLSPETHAELSARARLPEWRPGVWPPFRRAWQPLADIPGIAFPGWAL